MKKLNQTLRGVVSKPRTQKKWPVKKPPILGDYLDKLKPIKIILQIITPAFHSAFWKSKVSNIYWLLTQSFRLRADTVRLLCCSSPSQPPTPTSVRWTAAHPQRRVRCAEPTTPPTGQSANSNRRPAGRQPQRTQTSL